MSRQSDLILKMMEYEEKNAHRINHFLKVFSFAKTIGESEGLDDRTQSVLETAAIVHDIGIKPSMAEHGNANGPNQERLGIQPARDMLTELGYDSELTERVAYLVGHHHTYSAIDGKDYQILVEADFLVNCCEHDMGEKEIESVRRKIFKTETGSKILDLMH